MTRLTKQELKAAAERCEEIAEMVSDVAEGMRRLLSGALNERALVTLLYEACPVGPGNRKVGKMDIKRVLEGIVSLDEKFLTAEDADEE